MILTVDQLTDYIKCPMLYKYRYIDKLELYTEEELFKMAIRKTIDQMYYSLMDSQICSRGDVKYRWGDVWNLEVDKRKIIWMPNDVRRRYQMKGLGICIGIHSQLVQTKPKPIAISDVYGVQLGEHRLETDMRYVYEKDGVLTLIDYVVNDYVPDETTLASNLPLTAKTMIFEDVFKSRVKNILYYSTKKHTVFQTNRTPTDYKELKSTVGMISHCIDNKIFYKQYSDTCKACMYKLYCNR